MIKHCFGTLCIVLLFIVAACTSKKHPEDIKKEHRPVVDRDLPEILDDGVLNVVTTYSSTSYFLYRGQPMGYEYDLLKRFAKHLGVDFKIEISNDFETMYNMLMDGKVDLIAHGITITGKRKELVQFTDYLYLTHQVLVQKKPDNWRKMKWSAVQGSLIHDAIDLIGDTVSVRASSSYLNRVENLMDEMGGKIYIDTLPGDLSTDRIIEMVADGEIKYTFADNNIATINASYYPNLDVRVPVSFSQRMAWAIRPESDELLTELNTWIDSMKSGVAYYVIYNKYFKNERYFKRRENSVFYSINHNRISEYDDLLQVHADTLGWDWRLLASMVYQESKFNPVSESWAGAQGLMQMMPQTAERYGVIDRTDPEENLEGGAKVLKVLWDRFIDIPDSVQRIKFTMAAYNCGYSHVLDARTLAEKEGIDSYRWDECTEESMLKLSYPENYNKSFIKYGYVRGIEPVTYVKQIFSRYEHYCQLVE
ncbi:transporter substrate-binding domain-containing protein [Draconibacterium sp. IB214405]|uniref:transporter substrate-binding domain-containing protein n=1 Tax=Draconibacterium sp. IB214405 TaxID=3097352 RepID=UPI002A118F11|nr:transporter substrate-binding domain-containing protein [Draconibacterium sp. IB214405]MDX8337713.1 transporter substrate-binding domain-containing protein [Draconibacterium sp. IB214405]